MGVNKFWNLYKAGKKAKTISSVPPTVGSTGTSSLIKKYKTKAKNVIEGIKATRAVIKKSFKKD